MKLKVTSPWLGDVRRGKDKVRRFQRGHTDDILAFDLPNLQWTFREACDALHLHGVDTKTIRLEEGLVAPCLISYRRRYRYEQKKQEDFFEAIREGAVLTLKVLVTRPLPNNPGSKREPSQEELHQIFKFIGAMLGLSPWGGHFGYGRFDVMSLEEV